MIRGRLVWMASVTIREHLRYGTFQSPSSSQYINYPLILEKKYLCHHADCTSLRDCLAVCMCIVSSVIILAQQWIAPISVTLLKRHWNRFPLQGYKAQSEMVMEHMERLITECESRRESLVCEGVHLSLNFVVSLIVETMCIVHSLFMVEPAA